MKTAFFIVQLIFLGAGVVSAVFAGSVLPIIAALIQVILSCAAALY